MKEKIKVQTKFESRNPLVKKANEGFFTTISDLINLTKANQVLDCGCGEGIVLNKLRSRANKVRFEGFDVDSGSLKLAKRLNPKVDFKKGSIYKIPQKANSFPLVLCTEVLEHLEKPKDALKELQRVSSQYAIISVPHEPFFRMANMLRLKYLKRLGNTPDHINNWFPYGFKDLLSRFFLIKKEVYPFPWMMFLVSKK